MAAHALVSAPQTAARRMRMFVEGGWTLYESNDTGRSFATMLET